MQGWQQRTLGRSVTIVSLWFAQCPWCLPVVQSSERWIALGHCRGLSGPGDLLSLGTGEWHMCGNGIHSSAGGPCIGTTSPDPYKSGIKDKTDTSNKNVLCTHLSGLFMGEVTVKRGTSHKCFHPCKRKWTKSSQVQFKCQVKASVLFVKPRRSTTRASTAWWVHTELTVRRPGVGLLTTSNVNTTPWDVIYNTASEDFRQLTLYQATTLSLIQCNILYCSCSILCSKYYSFIPVTTVSGKL